VKVILTNKKLFRSRSDKQLSGVIGGVAKYIGFDTTILRLVLALTILFTGVFPGLLVYVICAMIIPLESTKEELNIIEVESKPVE
jgi:phage shock protein C